MSGGLAKGWVETSLGTVSTHPQYGWTCSSTKNGSLKLLRTTDISGGKVDWEEVPYCSEVPEQIEKFVLEKDDIVVSRAGSIGVSYCLSESDLKYKAVFASYLIRFRPLIPAAFVYYYLKSSAYWHFISASQLGIAVPNVNASKLAELPLPLPPLNEQKRIVAKLDVIMPRIDAVKERLEKIPAILKRFRQSVLTAAVTGKLTEKWREEHPEVESADVLLEKIDHERKKEKARAKAKCNFNITKSIDDRFIDFEVPVRWVKTNIDTISLYIVDCNHSTPKWTVSGKICLRTTNLLPGKLVVDEVRYVSHSTYETRIERLRPQMHDVVYSREGGILGVACALDIEDEVCLGQRMMMFRTGEFVNYKYLVTFLNSPLVRIHVENLIGGSAAPHINIRDIKQYPFPLPPLDEQKEIVRQVDKLFALADKVEEHYQKARARVDALAQSVLAKAFRGELVPQNPDDEPAEKLLHRIQEEKKKMEAELKTASRNARETRKNGAKSQRTQPEEKQASEP